MQTPEEAGRKRGAGPLVGRREFTLASALAMLAGVTITISDCSDAGTNPNPTPTPAPTPNPNPTPANGDVNGEISGNHGHVAIITRAQLTAGNALELNIQGTATHPHTVSLSQGELQQIAAEMRVSKESTNNSGHSHTVTFD
jgi:hypothetical protein